MDATGETQGQEELKLVSSDSAYGSSVMGRDPEDGDAPTAVNFNADMTHKVITELQLQQR